MHWNLWNKDDGGQLWLWSCWLGRKWAFAEWNKKYIEEVDSVGVQVQPIHNFFDGVRAPVRESWPIFLQLSHSWPGLLIWSSEDSENSIQLINIAVSLEQSFFSHHLSKDATYGPNIDGSRILNWAQEDFRRSVPKCHNFLGVRANWERKSSGQSEIPNFQII